MKKISIEQYKDEKSVMVCLGIGAKKTINIFPLEHWGKVRDMIDSLPLTSAKVRAFKRMFYNTAYEAEIDENAQIVISDELWNYLDGKEDSQIKVYERRAYEEKIFELTTDKEREMFLGENDRLVVVAEE